MYKSHNDETKYRPCHENGKPGLKIQGMESTDICVKMYWVKVKNKY